MGSIFWTSGKNIFFVKFTIMEFIKLSYIYLDTYLFVFLPMFITKLFLVS